MEDDLLPTDWAWTTLGEIADVVREHIVPEEHPKTKFNYLSIENVESNTGNLVRFSPTLGRDIRSAKIIFTSKDILYSKLRPYLNKVHLPTFDGISATDLVPIRPRDGISREYIAYFLRTRKVVEYANQRMRGIQLPRLPVRDILSLEIPLAPLAEQERIVSKVEGLLQDLKTARQALQKIPALMEQFRASVIVTLLRGEFTQHNESDESAEKLLDTIHAERVSRRGDIYPQALATAARGPRLPDGWVWTKIGEISLLVTKGSTPTSYGFGYVPAGINFVKVENLAEGKIKNGTITEFINNQTYEFFRRSQLLENDILFTIAGTIGKVAIVDKGSLPANINQAIAIIRVPTKVINPFYLRIVLESDLAMSSIRGKSRGVAMSNVSLQDVNNISFPLPPLSEQKQIVFAMDYVSDYIAVTTRATQHAWSNLDQLTHSILAKAFGGELVTQYPDDEPASELLQRIRSMRSESTVLSSVRRRR